MRSIQSALPSVSAVISLALMAGCSSTGIEPGAESTDTPPPPSSATLSGSVSWEADIALPPGAQLEVLLEDVSRADAPAGMLGQTRINAPTSPPVEFQLDYNPAQIDPRHTYALRARISLEGQLLLVTDTVHPVLTSGENTTDLLLRPVEPSNDAELTLDSAVALEETHWHLIQLGARVITEAEQQNPAHLVLQAQEHRAIGSGGCNRFFGSYSLQGDSLTFGQLAATMMACVKGMDVEQQFHDALAQTITWRIAQGHLELLDESGTVLAELEPRIAP